MSLAAVSTPVGSDDWDGLDSDDDSLQLIFDNTNELLEETDGPPIHGGPMTVVVLRVTIQANSSWIGSFAEGTRRNCTEEEQNNTLGSSVNNYFLIKQFGRGNAGIRFSKESNNLYNLNSYKYLGLANKKTVSIQGDSKDSAVVADNFYHPNLKKAAIARLSVVSRCLKGTSSGPKKRNRQATKIGGRK
ncbi:60S ribosomal protein L28-2 [Linum perenne]